MSKNPINQIYLQFLLCFTRRRLDVLDSAKEDVVAAEQLLQLQPLLDLLPEDLKDVRGGSSARANIPGVWRCIQGNNHIVHKEEEWNMDATFQWEPLERVSLVPPTPCQGCHHGCHRDCLPPAGACWGWESEPGWGVGSRDSARPVTEVELGWTQMEFNFGQSLERIWVPACVPGRPLCEFLRERQRVLFQWYPVLPGKRGSSFLRLIACKLERKVCLWTIVWYGMARYALLYKSRPAARQREAKHKCICAAHQQILCQNCQMFLFKLDEMVSKQPKITNSYY